MRCPKWVCASAFKHSLQALTVGPFLCDLSVAHVCDRSQGIGFGNATRSQLRMPRPGAVVLGALRVARFIRREARALYSSELRQCVHRPVVASLSPLWQFACSSQNFYTTSVPTGLLMLVSDVLQQPIPVLCCRVAEPWITFAESLELQTLQCDTHDM